MIEHPVPRCAGRAEAVAVPAGFRVTTFDVRVVMHDWIFFDTTYELGDGVSHREAAGDRDIGLPPGTVVHVDSTHRDPSNMNIISDDSRTGSPIDPFACQSMNKYICIGHARGKGGFGNSGTPRVTGVLTGIRIEIVTTAACRIGDFKTADIDKLRVSYVDTVSGRP
jgi:hypothetical protein